MLNGDDSVPGSCEAQVSLKADHFQFQAQIKAIQKFPKFAYYVLVSYYL